MPKVSTATARQALAQATPNTNNALTWMVPAMESAARNVGRRSLFGADKGAAARRKFLSTLRTTLSAMFDDGLIDERTSPDAALAATAAVVDMFAVAYPNWPVAYAFAAEFFAPPANPEFLAVDGDIRAAIAHLNRPAVFRGPL